MTHVDDVLRRTLGPGTKVNMASTPTLDIWSTLCKRNRQFSRPTFSLETGAISGKIVHQNTPYVTPQAVEDDIRHADVVLQVLDRRLGGEKYPVLPLTREISYRC